MWLVPTVTGERGVGLWLARLGNAEPADQVRIAVRRGGQRWVSRLRCAWQARDFGATRVWHFRSGLSELEPDTRYQLTLLDEDGGALDEAMVRTLPSEVPTMHRRPLTLYLSSCFSAQRDQGIGATRAARRLRGPDVPHAKLLCGDQVYLDLPASEWLPRDPEALRERLVNKYIRHWAPRRDSRQAGFGTLLRTGGNVLVSDDHEMWNNYPFAQAQLKSTWFEESRRDLETACLDLLHTFQFPGVPGEGPPLTALAVGPADSPQRFEMKCLDGRAARTSRRAHDSAQLDEVCKWLRGLKAPAALILSQPLFEDRRPTRLRARFEDAGLADLDDYAELAEALAAAPHDVLLLSGDIHGGRVARIALPTGRQLYEVVASPMSLLQPGAYYGEPAHPRFPVQGAALGAVEMRHGPVCCDHFVLLSLWRAGGALHVKVHFHRTDGSSLDNPRYEFSLY